MIKFLIQSTDADGRVSYLKNWGKWFEFTAAPKEAHRFNTNGAADSILQTITREKWPRYEHKIVKARIG